MTFFCLLRAHGHRSLALCLEGMFDRDWVQVGISMTPSILSLLHVQHLASTEKGKTILTATYINLAPCATTHTSCAMSLGAELQVT
jgi:hypothetical protein